MINEHLRAGYTIFSLKKIIIVSNSAIEWDIPVR
jgi:hypothetical protein